MAHVREGGFLISKIKQLSGRIFDRKLRKYGIKDLNAAQGRIIFTLWQSDAIPVTELARKTALGKTTLTSMIRRLEERGYIVRDADEHDGRAVIVSLTGKSRALEDRYEDVSREMTELFYRGLTERQVDEFEEILRHIVGNLTAHEEEYR